MVLAPTRLLVLGVIRLLQPVHGYDVRRELLSWQAEEWANVKPGSVYGALKTLERDGWIEAVETSQEGARPARTTYRTTAEGEKEFRALLTATWSHARSNGHPLFPWAAVPCQEANHSVANPNGRCRHRRGARVNCMDVPHYFDRSIDHGNRPGGQVSK